MSRTRKSEAYVSATWNGRSVSCLLVNTRLHEAGKKVLLSAVDELARPDCQSIHVLRAGATSKAVDVRSMGIFENGIPERCD